MHNVVVCVLMCVRVCAACCIHTSIPHNLGCHHTSRCLLPACIYTVAVHQYTHTTTTQLPYTHSTLHAYTCGDQHDGIFPTGDCAPTGTCTLCTLLYTTVHWHTAHLSYTLLYCTLCTLASSSWQHRHHRLSRHTGRLTRVARRVSHDCTHIHEYSTPPRPCCCLCTCVLLPCRWCCCHAHA